METERPPAAALRWAARALGGRIVGVRALQSSWLANHALDVVDARGQVRRVVLRRWARPGWDVDDPDFDARREAAVLGLLEESVVPAPRLLAADPDGAVCDVPALLVTRLDGHPPRRGEADLAQLAETLQTIHAVTGARGVVPAYRRYHQRFVPPAGSRVWARAAEVIAGPPPALPACFIHRDYHPGNTLWSGGRLTGVVDWTTGSWGPAAVDIGHLRWNLALDEGPAAADRFMPGSAHPYWDLVTAADVAPDLAPPDLARLERYVDTLL